VQVRWPSDSFGGRIAFILHSHVPIVGKIPELVGGTSKKSASLEPKPVGCLSQKDIRQPRPSIMVG
jgi:hypothetical protein